ncbi:MAG: hypothetical protein ACRDZW_01035, partial [Acidimicrobiales bacterium]
VVPVRAGVLSAVGLLGSPRQADVVRSWPAGPVNRSDPSLGEARFQLARAAARRVTGLPPTTPARVMLNHATGSATVTFGDGRAVAVDLSMDCRYQGQSHELTVPGLAAFDQEHRRRNGYVRPGTAVEVTALRASARLPPPVELSAVPPPPTARRSVRGPAAVAEPDCTVWVPPGWKGDVVGGGALVLRSDSTGAAQ